MKKNDYQSLVGSKNNLLTVVEYLGFVYFGEQRFSAVKCKCDCGGEKIVKVYQFKTGHVSSCGCLAEIYKKNFWGLNNQTTHGYTHHELYVTWSGIRARCYNIQAPAYKSYGGRGISVCEEWLSDFMNFYNWAKSNGHKKGLSIDRINNNGNYEPNNCRWATAQEQANNRRSSRLVELNGEVMSMASACRKVGMTYKIIHQRIVRDGLSFEEAISKPIISNQIK